MGRTLPSITNAFLHEQQSLARFRRALRLADQRALDDLLGLDPSPDGTLRLAAGEATGPAALHDETPSPYALPPADPAAPPQVPLRKRKWWAGG